MVRMYENIGRLRDNMRDNKTIITSFLYEFHNVKCIVLVNDIKAQGITTENKYALLQLILINRDDIKKSVKFDVNSKGALGLNVKLVREFFGVEYNKIKGGFIGEFVKDILKSVPTTINPNLDVEQKGYIVRYLSDADSEDPSRVYCFTIKRNPLREGTGERGKRSIFNSEKTKLLRPELYELYRVDKYLSFAYTNDSSKEKTDEEIIENFTQRQI